MSVLELDELLRSSDNTHFTEFPVLGKACNAWPDFFKWTPPLREPVASISGTSSLEDPSMIVQGTLPFIFSEALKSAIKFSSPIAVLEQPGKRTLTQRQCLSILACAFLCAFPDRKSNNCLSPFPYPSINMDELYISRNDDAQVGKLHMLFHYFDRCRERLEKGDSLGRQLEFHRKRIPETDAQSWLACSDLLSNPVMNNLGESIDSATGMLKIDFANQIIGGAALAHGCVQEEILFCLLPELLVSRLFCPVMQKDEAIIIHGAEQFSRPEGYGLSLRFGGPFHDATPLAKDGIMDSWICAIDALDFRRRSSSEQFSPEMILRELNKAFAGFSGNETPKLIATGNWGCGAFLGDPELKILIQWAAISRAGKLMHYFPWDNRNLFSRFPDLAKVLLKKNISVGTLSRFLFNLLPQKPVFDQLIEFFTREKD